MTQLSAVANAFSLENISNGIEDVKERFSNLGIMGITVLQNITNMAFNAGASIVKSLTFEPIMSGFSEYETKMNAIQTILTNTKSKGTTIDDVNASLQELNEYADQTIYNFSEMTRNIGTFTAAGVDLKTATSSIKGIANLAAGSGSSAMQASTAMYQLSQAIASGSVKLMDWNSVVNAGMGGELFQNALKKTAAGLGTVVDEGKSFRETLESGWLTTEILTKTLSDFANDPDLVKAATEVKTFTQLMSTMKESVQSGWAVTWEHILGNKNEAAVLFTNINNAFSSVLGPITEARNALLKFWHDNGGRAYIIEGISIAFEKLGSVLQYIKNAFASVFPMMKGEELVSLSQKFRDFFIKIKIGEELLGNIYTTFKGLFTVFKICVAL